MKVIIPVAGTGTRLRPHTLTQPKALLNVAGHPMIYHIIKQLIDDKLAESIIMVLGVMGDKISEYLDKTFNFKFDYVQQDVQHGLGHAIYCAKELFNPEVRDDVLIILGDTLFDVDLKDMCGQKYSVIGVKKVEDPRRFGVIEKNKHGFITRFIEKPASTAVSPSDEAIVGIYFLKNSALLFNSLEHIINHDIRSKGEIQLTDALETMIMSKEKIKSYNINGWLDCGKPETMLETNRYLLDKMKKKYNLKGVVLNYPVYIGDKTVIENSVIGPNATIANNCIIKNSVISDSIIDEYVQVENSVISDSLVGRNSRVINRKQVLNLGEYSEI